MWQDQIWNSGPLAYAIKSAVQPGFKEGAIHHRYIRALSLIIAGNQSRNFSSSLISKLHHRHNFASSLIAKLHHRHNFASSLIAKLRHRHNFASSFCS